MNEEFDRPLEEETTVEDNANAEKSISSDLIRGHINTIILRSLYDGDKYGYEIIAEIEHKSRGQYSLKQPSLYSALKRLEKEGYVTCYWGGSVGGGRRKYFSLTEQGKIVSERNQSEWEYSRTVIDSLISEKEFDFTQPAPTPVDMRVLKKSTSRVPTGGGEEEDEDEEKTALLEEQERLKAELEAERAALASEREAIEAEKVRILEEYERQVAERERMINEEKRAQEVAIAEQELRLKEREEYERQVAERERLLSEERLAHEKELAEQEKRIREEEASAYASRERRILHENYLRLINTPPAQQAEETDYNYYTPPVAEEKSDIHAEPERDYRTVVQALYRNATSAEESTEELKRTQPSRVDFYDLESRAAQDGIKINFAGAKTVKKDESTSENVVHKGKIVFLCSIIIFLFCIVEGSIVLALQKSLALPLFYPYFIWAAGLSFLLIAGVAYANRYGENSLKRAGMTLINCIVSYVLIVIFFLILALALKIDFTDASTLATYVLIPILFFLNVVVYGIAYTLQMKTKK